MDLVRWQVGFGVRYPGSDGHRALGESLGQRIADMGLEVVSQPFTVQLGGQWQDCTNVVARLGPRDAPPGLILGTHWDTRIVADRETDPDRAASPIPGANDGGSGTAVLLYLLSLLRGADLRREVQIAFLDAEDVGNLDGNPFAVGAAHLARNPIGGHPEAMIGLDMVGGRNMVLDRDAHALRHFPTRALTDELFEIGRTLGHLPFYATKPGQRKYIVSDHSPFLMQGIPAAILIDIDYPPWHTQGDLPDAMDGLSLAAVLAVVATYLERHLLIT